MVETVTTNADRTTTPPTIYDIAVSWGAVEVEGSLNGGEFVALGLPMMGGCQFCGATIAVYNAHPGTNGYLVGSCCLEWGEVFTTVEAFTAWFKSDDD